MTLALDAPDDADPQGIKEKVAMDFEKYGGVRVVKVERVEEYQQMTMEVQSRAARQLRRNPPVAKPVGVGQKKARW